MSIVDDDYIAQVGDAFGDDDSPSVAVADEIRARVKRELFGELAKITRSTPPAVSEMDATFEDCGL